MVSVVEIRDEKSGLMGCIIQMAGMASGTNQAWHQGLITHDGRKREVLDESVVRPRLVVPVVRFRSTYRVFKNQTGQDRTGQDKTVKGRARQGRTEHV